MAVTHTRPVTSANQLRKQYLDFFAERGHAVIPSAPLIPENDPTVLFTTAGMHPLVPYLLGEPHPLGNRLVDVQKCLRTDDIDEVGDLTHLTFFEMLGNWSLGDYFKRDALAWSWEFLTQVLGLEPERLSVSVFEGDADAARDDESAEDLALAGRSLRADPLFTQEGQLVGTGGQTGPCGPELGDVLRRWQRCLRTGLSTGLLLRKVRRGSGTTSSCSTTNRRTGPTRGWPRKTSIPAWASSAPPRCFRAKTIRFKPTSSPI